ncbi:MAG: HNH endonuclease signature motif containing protein [Phycisphaerae bacterium]
MPINSLSDFSPKIAAWHRELLIDKVDRSGQCWLWTGLCNADGYGVTTVDHQQVLAHRLSYILKKGDIPEGLVVRHICPGGGNRSCVKPDHLVLGTRGDNNRDTVRAGRHRKAKVLRTPVNTVVGMETLPVDILIRRLFNELPEVNANWIARKTSLSKSYVQRTLESIRTDDDCCPLGPYEAATREAISKAEKEWKWTRVARICGLSREHVTEILGAVRSSNGSRPMTKLEKRFWASVRKEKDCWIWCGLQVCGYGRISIDGRGAGAHVVSWLLHNGLIPNNYVVCHNCPGGDNPLCVNPRHLFLGTQQDNINDRDRKASNNEDRHSTVPKATKRHKYIARVPRGQASKNAKLDNVKVRLIRAGFIEGRTLASMARQFDVSEQTIANVVNRKSWKHVSKPKLDC